MDCSYEEEFNYVIRHISIYAISFKETNTTQ